ncbi:MAG: methyl-accepting chemotaxis protein [Nitrospirae bacterium]|nr:methyl-accepting chemotaxis protein [Nitrospirota bacterium]
MKFSRRRYIIDTRFQTWFIVPFIVIVIIGSIIASLTFNYLAIKRLEPFLWSAHINLKTTDEVIGPLFLYVNTANFLFVSFVLILFGVWMVRMLSGILYKMAEAVRAAGKGDLSAGIILSRRDEFQDVAVTLNNTIKSLRERFFAIKQDYAQVSNGIYQAEAAYRDGKPVSKDVEEALKGLDAIKKRIGQG